MDFILALILVLLVMHGLGAWLPVRFIGIRLMVGGAAIPIAMHVGTLGAGLSVSTTGGMLFALALGGLVRRFAHRRLHAIRPELLLHPATLLPLLIALAVLVHGDFRYQPYSWDEFSSWLYWARQQHIADAVWRPDMQWSISGYTQGWPLMMALAQLPWSEFSEARGLAPAALLHVGLMGTVYDVLRGRWQRTGYIPEPLATIAAWLVVLLLLALQAAWTLMPQLLLIEKPQIYLLSAALVMLLLPLAGRSERVTMAFAVGMIAAAMYFIKVSTLAFAPALLVATAIWGWKGNGDERLRIVLALFAPLLLAVGFWAALSPFPPVASCFTQTDTLLPGGISALISEHAGATTGRLISQTIDYLTVFKWPLTVASVVGLIAGVATGRAGPTVLALAFFTLAHMMGLFSVYLSCLNEADTGPLPSLQRYLRVPLRTAHTVGIIVLVLVAGEALCRRYAALLRSRSVMVSGAIVLAALAILQLMAMERALANVSRRVHEVAFTADTIRRLYEDGRLILDHLGSAKERPLVAVISQGDDGFTYNIVHYLALNSRRGDPLTRFDMLRGFSWGPAAQNRWMHVVTSEQLGGELRRADVIWPDVVDDWVGGVLREFQPDGGCDPALGRHFLIRHNGRFFCLAKR